MPTSVLVWLALLLPAVPGALNPQVTQQTIGSTVCVSGWTKTIRPSAGYTSGLKRRQILQLGYRDTNPAHYEEDHLVPLELGGAPRGPRNLWPEPHTQSALSDPYENRLHRQLCAGQISLAQGRRLIVQFKRTRG